MDRAAILHRPLSEYAHALDDTTYVFRLRAACGDVQHCVFCYADRAEQSDTLTFFSAPMTRVRSDAVYDWFEIELHTPFLRIAYYFELHGEDEILYYLGGCLEDSPNQSRSDYFQLPFNHRSDRMQVPEWAADAVVYNIFPDSFASGYRTISCEKTSVLLDGEPCRSLLGGTLRGIRENLDHIAGLGCNCIYLNPIFAASSYHKYDTLDYFRIDPTRGTVQDLRELVSAAHARGIRVILDGVFNHVCWRHPFFRDVLEKGRSSAYYDWFYCLPEAPRYPGPGGHPEYICFSYVPEMPKTNTAHPEVMDYFCRVGEYWLRECDVDGWRLDVANEVDDSFLQIFRRRIKAVKPDALVIGEVWENAAHYLENNLLDSAMNYDFRRFCRQFFAEQSISAEEFDVRVSELLMRYPRQAIPAQLNLLDSHDVSRFLTLCGGDRDKMELAVVFQMTFPGMPCVFYGDEKGLQGRTEPEYRQAMDFSREDSMEQVYRRLIALRNSTPALRHGRFTTVLAKGTVYVYQRQTQSERVTVYLNTGPDAISVPSGAVLSKRESNGLMSGGGYSILIETIGD